MVDRAFYSSSMYRSILFEEDTRFDVTYFLSKGFVESRSSTTPSPRGGGDNPS